MRIIITESQRENLLITSVKRRYREILDSLDDFIRYSHRGSRPQSLSEDDFLEEITKMYVDEFIRYYNLETQPQDIPVLEELIKNIIEKWVRKYHKWYQKRHVNINR